MVGNTSIEGRCWVSWSMINRKVNPLAGGIASQLLLAVSFPRHCFAHGEEVLLWVAGLSLFHILAPFLVRRYVARGFFIYLALYAAVLAAVWHNLLTSSYRSIEPYHLGLAAPLIYWLLVVLVSRSLGTTGKKLK